MDGSTLEHSDSDSGESWTILEPVTGQSEEGTDALQNLLKLESESPDNIEKDEDTDGISIISDSDRESNTPSDLKFDRTSEEQSCPAEQQIPEYVSVTPLTLPVNNNKYHESIRSDDDFLGVGRGGKVKTYVHRRNKRLSTVLNIIMLGSFITAAGVAIGHMWGVREDCKLQAAPSVNKILSNLYKLQEENVYLRNKIKELSILGNVQMQQKKIESDKVLNKQFKCKKVFEESLNNKSANKPTKCIDEDIDKMLSDRVTQSEYEKEFLHDIVNLENVYNQNKDWLDDELRRRMKNEKESIKKLRNKFRPNESIQVNNVNEQNMLKNEQESVKNIVEDTQEPLESSKEHNRESLNYLSSQYHKDVKETLKDVNTEMEPNIIEEKENLLPGNKISYADSLKHDPKSKGINKRETNKMKKEVFHKRKSKKSFVTTPEYSLNEDEFKKDDRYSGNKFKFERKKNDHQKGQRKQKRKNKYEQWEMKGGYMKDYDTISIPSFQENEILKTQYKDSPQDTFIDQFIDTDDKIMAADQTFSEEDSQFNQESDWYEKRAALRTEARKKYECDTNSKGEKPIDCQKYSKNDKGKDSGWYDKHFALRAEARKKLEKELFGESKPNNAGWYFRRMQKREQCRAKGDNSTHRKFLKENWKFMKY